MCQNGNRHVYAEKPLCNVLSQGGMLRLLSTLELEANSTWHSNLSLNYCYKDISGPAHNGA